MTVAAEDGRRRLTARQVAVFERLVDAAAEEAREHGYEGTTVRGAARRAGVAPATAYTCFASKDHLLAEVLWRCMDDLPALAHHPGTTPLERVTSEIELLGLFMADEPVLAAALGAAGDPAVIQGLELAYSGAMLWAGMGHLAFAEVPEALGRLATRLLGARR